MPLIQRGLGAHSLLLWNSLCTQSVLCLCTPFHQNANNHLPKADLFKIQTLQWAIGSDRADSLILFVGYFDDLSKNFTHKRSSFGCSCSSFYWLNLLIKHQLFVCWSIWWVLDLVTYLLPMERNKKKIIAKTAFMNVRKISVICSAVLDYQGLSFVWNY